MFPFLLSRHLGFIRCVVTTDCMSRYDGKRSHIVYSLKKPIIFQSPPSRGSVGMIFYPTHITLTFYKPLDQNELCLVFFSSWVISE